MAKEFEYSIGKPIDKKGDKLQIYQHGNVVHTGTMADAEKLRDFVRKKEKDNSWDIYIIEKE